MERETDQKKEGQQVTAVKTKADQLNCKHYKQYKREPDPFSWDIILPLQKKHQMSYICFPFTYDGGEDHETEDERCKYHENKVQVGPLLLAQTGSEVH